MNPDEAVSLVTGLFRATFVVAGPLLIVTLVAGVIVGIVQTATQINEASISFLTKVIALVCVGIALGSQIATYTVDYTRQSFEAISRVVR